MSSDFWNNCIFICQTSIKNWVYWLYISHTFSPLWYPSCSCHTAPRREVINEKGGRDRRTQFEIVDVFHSHFNLEASQSVQGSWKNPHLYSPQRSAQALAVRPSAQHSLPCPAPHCNLHFFSLSLFIFTLARKNRRVSKLSLVHERRCSPVIKVQLLENISSISLADVHRLFAYLQAFYNSTYLMATNRVEFHLLDLLNSKIGKIQPVFCSSS